MAGINAQEGSVRRQRNRPPVLLVMTLLGAIGIAIAWATYGWLARAALLRTMVGEGSYSLKSDPVTVSRVKAVLPQLVEIHRKAVVDCGTASMADLSRMDAFNRRIKSWHAILMATELTADPTSRAYIESFVNSDRALPEEVMHGKTALQQTDAKESE